MAKILSVHSFYKSTGKSTVTANVATRLAQKGNRVGIVDADIYSPGIHFFFQMDDEKVDKTFNDYLWGKCAIEQAAYDLSDKLGVSGALYLIPASTHIGQVAKILRERCNVALLNDGFRSLIDKLNLDYLLIDTHSGLNEETLLSIAISDILIITLRTDQRDFQGSAVLVDVARRLEIPRLYLVVNEAISSYEPDALRQQIEETYDAPVAAIIPLSEDIAALQSSGIFALRFPDHPVSQRFDDIVAAIEAKEV